MYPTSFQLTRRVKNCPLDPVPFHRLDFSFGSGGRFTGQGGDVTIMAFRFFVDLCFWGAAMKTFVVFLILAFLSFQPVKGQDIFVANWGIDTIAEYGMDGSTVNPSLVSLGNGVYPFGLALSGSNLFVAIQNGTIGEYGIDGSTVNAWRVSGSDWTWGVAVSGSNVFVAQENPAAIGKYSTSGAIVNPSLVPGLNFPAAIAVSGSNLFVADNGNGTIGEYGIDGSTVNASLVSGLRWSGWSCPVRIEPVCRE